MLDILIRQRVNTTWKSTIVKPVPLQQKLFLSPMPLPSIKDVTHVSFKKALKDTISWALAKHHLLNELQVFDKKGLRRPECPYLARPNSSWRRILATQTPTKCLLLVHYLSHEITAIIRTGKGVVAGEVVRAMAVALEGNNGNGRNHTLHSATVPASYWSRILGICLQVPLQKKCTGLRPTG
ncbi:hypothetical protein MMC16_001514 [Acarospora aff. strigata]|nr:hypothetical protein [Acarospora aff. strigata]